MTGRFAGKVAIITGGANGIGAATVRRFVAEGAAVVVADLDAQGGGALSKELGEVVTFVHSDISEEAAWDELTATAMERGGLDIVHTNAFLARLAPADALPAEIDAGAVPSAPAPAAVEYGPEVRVNAVLPGAIET